MRRGSLRRSARVFLGGQAVLTVATLGMLAVRLGHRGGGRRICQERWGTWAGRAILRLNGIDLVVHRSGPWPDGPVFYMANHSSSLDLPLLMALGMPNTRTFIKQRFRRYGALGSALVLTGTLFTAPQDQHTERVRRFRQAEQLLRRTGESVFGSPEGTRVEGGEIGPFNKGVFHLVTVLGLPIVPILISIPAGIDPGSGIAALPGTVQIHVGDPIDTSAWALDELEQNTEAVRERFVAWRAEVPR